MAHSRRTALSLLAGSLAALAGCTDTSTTGDTGTTAGETDTETDESNDTQTRTTESGGATPTATDAASELDLREANVVGVATERTGDGEYEFAVTLFHDDEGEDGYANWWQVETPDGDRLGRRKLLHAHGTRRFTRSETITTDADCVVVRGHDQTHGYGGRAALVSLPDGAVSFRDQGADRQSMADESC